MCYASSNPENNGVQPGSDCINCLPSLLPKGQEKDVGKHVWARPLTNHLNHLKTNDDQLDAGDRVSRLSSTLKGTHQPTTFLESFWTGKDFHCMKYHTSACLPEDYLLRFSITLKIAPL